MRPRSIALGVLILALIPQLLQTSILAQEPTPTALVIGPSPTAEPEDATGPSPTAAASPVAGVDGSTYTSPSFGFSLTWDETWRPVEARSEHGEDRLQLTDDVSDVTFRAHAGYGGDPVPCLEEMIDGVIQAKNNSNVGPAFGTDGQPLRGGDATQQFAVLIYQIEVDGSPRQTVAHLVCRVLVLGNAVLEIAHLTSFDSFSTEASKVQTLLAGLVVPAITETDPVGCEGVAAWLAETRPNVERVEAINKESENSPPDTNTWQAWAAELKLLAEEQSTLQTPASLTQLNAALAALFQTFSDLINEIITAGQADDMTRALVALDTLAQAEQRLKELHDQVDELARNCPATP